MSDLSVLCQTPSGLAKHVLQLLSDAGVTGYEAQPRGTVGSAAAEQGTTFIVVPHEDLERARSVIGLVLPQLLDPNPPNSGLSEQLVRAEEPEIRPLKVWRGPAGSLLDEPDDSLHDEDGDFVPPEPPPVPKPRDRISRFAWAAVLGGPLLTILAIVMRLDGFFIILGVGLFFGGFGTLIARAPERRHPDDLGNGAVL